ncbi:MAG: insulinase family protein [Elusimicrobia bacterium]|nr:insulinase family protein [Elusimicrobiota bacterium]
MNRRPLASLLSAVLFLSSWLPAAAQMARGPVIAMPNVAKFPAFPTQARSLESFSSWLGSPAGALVLAIEPRLAGLRSLDFKSEKGLLAIAPLIRELPAGLLAQLENAATMDAQARDLAIVQLIHARQRAETAVNTEIAKAISGLQHSAFVNQAAPEELDRLAEHIEIFGWYGGGVVEAAAFVRETSVQLREALTHTQRVAEETADRLGKMKPADDALLIDAPKAPAPEVPAAPKKKGPGLNLPVHTFKLENGLTVVVSPDHASPTVAVSLTYKVGSQHESKGLSGFAHLFEHLMAQGTKNLKPRELSKLIEGNGGDRNAYTTRTHTGYYSVIPKAALAMVMWAEADRMGSLDVNARALALEQQVVLEEMRRSYLNQPYRTAAGKLSSIAFDKWENGHTTIGEAADVRDAKIEDVRAFFQSHYAPNNAVLSISGDVTEAEVRTLAEKHFGPIPSRPIPAEPDFSEPPLAADRKVEIPDSLAKLPLLLAAWRAPERGSKDFWAMSLLMDIFGSGEQSPVYQALVKSAQAALSVGAGFPWYTSPVTMHGPDLFGLEMMLKVGTTVEQAMAQVDAVVKRIAEEGPSEADLKAAKAQNEFAQYDGLQSLIGRAKTFGTFTALVGDPKNLGKDLEAMLAVSVDDVRDAARRWMAEAHRVLLHITPAPAVAPSAPVQAPPTPAETPRAPGEKPPAVGASVPAPLPKLERFTLKNGLKGIFIRDARLPRVEARLSLKAGRTAERPGEEGLSAAAAELILKGAAGRDAASLARSISSLGWAGKGGSLISADDDHAVIGAAGLARNAAPFFHQLAQVLRGADFPAAEVDLWKKNAKEALSAKQADPEYLMDERVNAEHYGADSVLGRPVITEAEIDAVDSERLAAFRSRAYSPQDATLVLAGDLDPSDVRDMLEDTLKRWTGAAPSVAETAAPPARDARLVVVDRPGSEQANLTISQTVPLTRKDADFLPFLVATHILGGNSTARLFLNLRVDKGYTYGSYAGAMPKGDGVLWIANAETRNEVALPALNEMRKEIDRMRDEAVPAETLEAAKKNLAGRFATQLASMAGVASRVAGLENQGVDSARELAAYIKRLEALTPEDIQRVAREYLNPGKMVTIAVGDKATIDPLLAPYTP